MQYTIDIKYNMIYNVIKKEVLKMDNVKIAYMLSELKANVEYIESRKEDKSAKVYLDMLLYHVHRFLDMVDGAVPKEVYNLVDKKQDFIPVFYFFLCDSHFAGTRNSCSPVV